MDSCRHKQQDRELILKILIVKLSSIGDVVHTLPALKALKDGFKGAAIDWIVEEDASGLLKGNNLINDIIVVKKRGFMREPFKTLSIIKKLKKNNYDMVIDFQGLFKSAFWVLNSGAKRKIGFDNGREFSHLPLNEKLPAYNKNIHAVDRYLTLVDYVLDSKNEVHWPVVNFTQDERTNIEGLLEEGGITGDEPFYVVNTQARWETKLWGSDKFVNVIKEIYFKHGIRGVLVGAKNDLDVVNAIADNVGAGAVNLCGKTTLRELACLMGQSKFVITVDSGPMHIAVAVGAKVISIFGPTSEKRTGPYGNLEDVVRLDIECAPCFKRHCSHLSCMKDLEEGLVIDKAEKEVTKSVEGL